jgi:hypothetical protein
LPQLFVPQTHWESTAPALQQLHRSHEHVPREQAIAGTATTGILRRQQAQNASHQ